MDPYSGKSQPTAPPPYGWETHQSNVAINQPSAPYPTYAPHHAPGPQQPLLGPPQQPGGPRQPLLQGQAQYEYYQGYQACPPYPQPQSGYQPAPSYPNNPSHGQPKPSVVIVGGCPACRVGVLEDDFTCFGVCCAIFCFPIGILCCLAMRQRRCSNCGANFS